MRHRRVPRWVDAALQPIRASGVADGTQGALEGHLADYRQDRLRIACGPCGRDGQYRITSLRTMLGNPPMSEVPRLLAIRAGCPLATRFPGHECRAYFVDNHQVGKVEHLAAAYHAGWQVTLRCERSRQGLKSVKPCRIQPFLLDLASLVAALGHEFPISQLGQRLLCPGCGSRHFTLAWIAPKAPPAEPLQFKRTA